MNSPNSARPKLYFKPTDSGQHIQIQPDQVTFRTSSLALLRAKGKAPKSLFFEEDGSASSASFGVEGARLVLQHMYDLWRENRLCDVVLHTAGGDLTAHKLALGAHSPALADKFKDFPTGEIIAIDVTDISRETVQCLLHFIYTTDIKITRQNVAYILFGARELELHVVIHLCLEFLSSYNETTAIVYLEIAESNGLQQLASQILTYIAENFVLITNSQSFLQMSFQKLLVFLSNDSLNVLDELQLFYAVVRWVDYDRNQRLPVAALLLRCVRFQLIPPELIATKVETVDWIFTPRNCHDILFAAYR